MTLTLPPVYAITDTKVSGIPDHAVIAERLIRVGIRVIQVRDKEIPDRDLLASVERTRSIALPAHAMVLVNDRVDVARLSGVGVHLGADDLPAADARRVLGPEAIIGVSTHDQEAASRAFAEPSSDYVAFGPIYASRTKPGGTDRGVAALAEVARGKTKPLVAIGGIDVDHLAEVWDAGADSAAMIAGLLSGSALEVNARRALDLARRRRPIGRVYLTGFMGSGKTAIGRRIAQRLDLPFVDLDAEIERTSGVTIRALFESEGEEAFRERETVFLFGTESLPSAIVATGGGCYVRPENRERIGRLGTAVFLDVPFATILSRLQGKTDRPLFTGAEQARRLLAEREPFYRMGSIPVMLPDAPIEENADRVLNALFDRFDASVRF
ncbi:MAG TPA: thiamine phosphate synthase [Thermoanaerobaculia bacterium]